MKKKISILGSTGSIGETTLKIIKKKKNLFQINILVANKNYKKICNQINIFKPKIFIIDDIKTFLKVKKFARNKKTKILNKINEKNIIKNDISISAIPGIAGLNLTIYFAQHSKKLLIANKESIICGWDILIKTIKKNKTRLIPIDSEHFSLLKLLEISKKEDVKKIYITASGGPFFKSNIKFNKIKPYHALKHPKWSMGKKISVDSATMMNKIFELVEAKKLFPFFKKKIGILIHPQSLVHAVIVYKNGLTNLLYHQPNMIIPIANAIFDSKIDISEIYKKKNNFGDLQFYEINEKNFFPYKILNKISLYKSSPIIVNAVNEILVDQFLKRKISFLSIIDYISRVFKDKNYKKYAIKSPNSIKKIYEIDNWARAKVKSLLN
tara:strand:- start:1767 stop:2912 length:1146 start_codon:yes stop_codon:yes gene_type:complete